MACGTCRVLCLSTRYALSILTFLVENSKEKQKPDDKQGGIGLTNVKRRLELLYPGRYVLKTDESDERFIAQLTIHLT